MGRWQKWPVVLSTGGSSSELQRTVLRGAPTDTTVESVCWAETKWSRWEHAPLCLHWIWVCRDTQTHTPTHTFQFAHIWSLNNSQVLVWRGNTGIVQQLSLACQTTDYRFYWGSPVTSVSCFICLSQVMLHYKSNLILMFSFEFSPNNG